MQKELESGNLYVVLVSLKFLKNWGFVPTKDIFCNVCKAPLYETSTYTYTSITNNIKEWKKKAERLNSEDTFVLYESTRGKFVVATE